ncbi:hypothetical protein HPP92_020802 [Vanilla planifolia]|uniref:Homeobox domain-containing protein n=1 Tax=Vanilla planifolia TaxID=51239 RepID=A0A835UK44_VANPL|nr:hypothetical protein HPP92_020802 [Vanilla planifolia]
MPQAPSTRWCPTSEQLMMLEELYRTGVRTPNASQIQQITAHLSHHGKIEGKNVFYWFQNHKARDRQKLRRKLSRQPLQAFSQYSSSPHFLPQLHQTFQPQRLRQVFNSSLTLVCQNYEKSVAFFMKVVENLQGEKVHEQRQGLDLLRKLEEGQCAWITSSPSGRERETVMEMDGGGSAFCRQLKTLDLFPTRSTGVRDECEAKCKEKLIEESSENYQGMLKPTLATAVLAIAVVLSFIQRLGLEWEMVYSIARAFLQLSIMGFVLEFVFSRKNAGWIVLAYLFMVIVAGYTAGQRAKHVPHGKYIAGASILVGTTLTMFILVMLNVFPFTPRYIIPVSGMMVGNAMTVTGVTMKKLREDLKMQKDLVETALALGATPRQATVQQVKRSLIIALSPVLDNAKTVGLISLPGAMTGLIMAGAPPMEAIQLQIVVMNMLVGASTVSSIMSTYLCWPAFFTKAHQLEYEVFNAS